MQTVLQVQIWERRKNMNRKEVIWMIKRNRTSKRKAIILIADFLVTTKARAKKIYEEEFENE